VDDDQTSKKVPMHLHAAWYSATSSLLPRVWPPVCMCVHTQAFAALASCDDLALEPLLTSIQSVIADFPIREGLPSHICPQLFGMFNHHTSARVVCTQSLHVYVLLLDSW
jgi:hypothetical protein